MNTLKLYTAAALAAFVFLAIGATLDGPDDIAAAQAQADYLAELEQAEVQQAQTDALPLPTGATLVASQ